MILKLVNDKSVVFIFLLLFASLGWVYVKLQETYSTNFSVQLEIKNLPTDKVPLKPIPKSIELNVEGIGSEIIWQQLGFSKKKLELDFDKFQEQELVTAEELKNEFNKDALALNISKIYPDTLFMQMDEGISKKIPIKFNHKIIPALGFTVAGEVQFSPDSVQVNGPKKILDTLNYWSTKKIVHEDISSAQSGRAELEKSNNTIYLKPNFVVYNYNMEQLTEITLDNIPVQMKNPSDSEFILFSPSEVSISFNVPISKLQSIDASEFKIIADYKPENLAEQTKIPLRILNTPENISSIRLNPGIVDYIIKTKDD